MKYMLISLIALSFSCKDCYECSNPATTIEICNGDYDYEFIKEGIPISDPQGDTLNCVKK